MPKIRNPVRLPARSKYRAVRTEVDGIVFASKREAKRYSELKMLRDSGHIFLLVRQPRYRLVVNGKHCGDYVADFEYFPMKAGGTEYDPGRKVIEDVKGVKTPVYRLKKKLVEAIYGIEIREV